MQNQKLESQEEGKEGKEQAKVAAWMAEKDRNYLTRLEAEQKEAEMQLQQLEIEGKISTQSSLTSVSSQSNSNFSTNIFSATATHSAFFHSTAENELSSSSKVTTINLKMKKKTFGLSNISVTIDFDLDPCSDLIPTRLFPPFQRLSEGTQKYTIRRWQLESPESWSETNTWMIAIREALQNYKNNRRNGSSEDNPSRVFPNDGIYKWETPDKTSSKILYTEDPKDAAWMAKRDSNCLKRVAETEKVIYEITPFPIELIVMVIDYLVKHDTVQARSVSQFTVVAANSASAAVSSIYQANDPSSSASATPRDGVSDLYYTCVIAKM